MPSTERKTDFDVAIVGGGIAGSQAAKSLSEVGFRTCLVKGNEPPEERSVFMNADHLPPSVLIDLRARRATAPVTEHLLVNADQPKRSWGKVGTRATNGYSTIALFYPPLIGILQDGIGPQVEIISAQHLSSWEQNGMVVLTLSDGRKITSGFMVDASGSHSPVSRNHITQNGEVLLKDDPLVCWMMGVRAYGEFRPNICYDPIGREIGGQSWILPYSQDYGDIIASDVCRLSEVDRDLQRQILRNLLQFCEQNNLCQVKQSEQEIFGIIRMQPTRRADALRTKLVYQVGASAGMGSPLMAEVIPPALKWAQELAKAVAAGQSPQDFYRLWRQQRPMFAYDLEIAMLLRRAQYKKRGQCGSNAPIYQAILNLPETAQQQLLHDRRIPKRYLPLVALSIIKNPELALNIMELLYYLAQAKLLYQ